MLRCDENNLSVFWAGGKHLVTHDEAGKGLPAYMIMTENPITVTPGVPVIEAVRIMREVNVRHLPVIDKNNKHVGMISLRDIIDAVLMFMEVFTQNSSSNLPHAFYPNRVITQGKSLRKCKDMVNKVTAASLELR